MLVIKNGKLNIRRQIHGRNYSCYPTNPMSRGWEKNKIDGCLINGKVLYR